MVADRPATSAARRLSRGALLLVWDVAVVILAFAITKPFAGRGFSPVEFGMQPGRGTGPLEPSGVVFAIAAVIGLALVRERETGLGGRVALLVRLGIVAALSAWVALLAAEVGGWPVNHRQLIVVSLTVPVAWLVGRIVLDLGRRRERVVLIGSGQIADHIAELARRHPESGLDVLGWLDDDPLAPDEASSPHLGPLSDLPVLLAAGRVDRVVVCFSQARDGTIAEAVRECDAHNVQIDMVPRMFELVPFAPGGRSLAGFPLVPLTASGRDSSQAAAKRAFDLTLSLTLIALTLPLMGLIAIAIRLDSRGPALYRSTRLGRNGRPFRMLKFRTMVVRADELHDQMAADLVGGELKRADDPRITRVGRVLRGLSLDELPQLFNVVAGSMSVVGPRPVLATERHGLEGWAARRHGVRPGVTGLWQVLGRSTIPWKERMQLDYTYARHWSLTFDLRILASTFAAVVSRKGAC